MKQVVINLESGIDSLTNFKRNTTGLIAKLRKTGQPIVLTVNGKAEVVVQDAASYQQLLEAIERVEAIQGIKNGLEEKKKGLGRPAAETLERIRKKHRIR